MGTNVGYGNNNGGSSNPSIDNRVIVNVTLNKDDYVYPQVRNEDDTTNVTLELDSYHIVEEK